MKPRKPVVELSLELPLVFVDQRIINQCYV
jgi:hypothetical protein